MASFKGLLCHNQELNYTQVLSHPEREGQHYYSRYCCTTHWLSPVVGSCWCGRSVCSCSWLGNSCRHSHCCHKHRLCSHRRDNREPRPSQLTVSITLWGIQWVSLYGLASPPPSHQLHTSHHHHHHQQPLGQTATTNWVCFSLREASENVLHNINNN